ncbi:dehydrogenase [Streptomyces eurocidicus]|uniref:Dehydrogenase n=1 Tax=Streptomyces eurocidicus TaxID=66423 RepID=A0A2N8NVH0_STREU|nr:SDR family NAD(P)-dependent oxidoreductase [Streptomyces eurocidicus]MBB5122243.1 NAD(P)-dependent dehydrogenase (short-subunit alcohol dehydrogenase family) [Streptomyces eurocidicus]MBF6055128.1 SDR family oxidoreductase [Streptomyces eurocidicus]PNE32770.1 dehydrogenase [Streptomyces eurocidicus]
MGRLDRKTVLISGSSTGIGRAAALEFAGEGARVVGCGRDPGTAAETVRLVKEAGGEMVALAPVDLADRDGARAWIDFALYEYGRFDVLCNNASSMRNAPFDRLGPDDWHHTIRNELDLVYQCTRAAWPHLVEQGGGVVLNIASISGSRGALFVQQAAHGAAKGGVLALTRHLCGAGAAHGIRVNSISPGLIRTRATAPHIDDPGSGVPALLKKIPAGRVGRPEEVARLAAFLASDDAAYVNGADFVIDGGISAMAG